MKKIKIDIDLDEVRNQYKKENIIKVLKILEKEHCLSLVEIQTILSSNYISRNALSKQVLLELNIAEKIDLYLYRITIPRNKAKLENIVNNILRLDTNSGNNIETFRVFKYTKFLQLVSKESVVYSQQVSDLYNALKCRRSTCKTLVKLGFLKPIKNHNGFEVIIKKPDYIHGRQLLNAVKEEYLIRYSTNKKVYTKKKAQKTSEVKTKKEKASFFRKMFNFIKNKL